VIWSTGPRKKKYVVTNSLDAFPMTVPIVVLDLVVDPDSLALKCSTLRCQNESAEVLSSYVCIRKTYMAEKSRSKTKNQRRITITEEEPDLIAQRLSR